MTNKDLANVIFPNINHDIKYYDEIYPERKLEDGACVTRFAPSPTGFVHIGNIFSCLIDFIIARNTHGIFYLRNEDTDQKREIKNAMELVLSTMKDYDIIPDEYEINNNIIGNYGPYIQSKRIEIYHTFIKHFIEIGRAYPCFCTEEDLKKLRDLQESKKARIGYYGKYAKCRNLSIEEVVQKINNNEPYVIRFKSMGNFNNKVSFDDEVRGKIVFPENDLDQIIMKSSDKLPTYHFAHLVDDYLMKTTHVVRGEEWLSSVPLHIELFNALGVIPPKYIHIPLLLKKDGDNVRKISKRLDPEARMTYYREKGYPSLCVIESLMTIINSNYEEWHESNPEKSFLDFIYNPKKMSSSGAFYPIEKLDNISKNYLSKQTANDIYDGLNKWSNEYDEEFNNLINNNKEYTINILNIEREQSKPRKDFACYSEIKNCIWYMYDELFNNESYEWQIISNLDDIKNILNSYIKDYYDEKDDKETWWNKIKQLSNDLNYASDMKDYKLNPDNYKGSIADISMVLRVAFTTKSTTPDLYEIMKLLGKDRLIKRVNKILFTNK